MKKSKKRKTNLTERPSKRAKKAHNERFKFVLAPSGSDSSDEEEVPIKKVTKNNLKIKLQDLRNIYESPSGESNDDDSWMDEDLESFSDEEEEVKLN